MANSRKRKKRAGNARSTTGASAKKKAVSSPQATGGSGTHFEQHVDATFLALLLVRAVPPVLTDCQLAEVHFQVQHQGWSTDDTLLIGVDGAGRNRKLAMQVKRGFTIGAGDDDCKATFCSFWEDFKSHGRFDPDRDALAIVVQRATQVLLRYFAALLDCARASRSGADFRSRVETEGFLHASASAHATDIRSIIEECEGSAISDDLFWKFIRCVHVLPLDLATSSAQTEAWVKTLLCHAAAGEDPAGTAQSTWLELLEIASAGMGLAASHTLATLPEGLRERHECVPAHDWKALELLKEHSSGVIEGIRTTVGPALTIPRSKLHGRLLECLEANSVAVVTGPAGQGKSVVARAVYEQIARDHFAFAFRAEEFAGPHVDGTLHHAQVGLSAERLFGLLAGQGRKLLLVESVERLLESSVRDAFTDLLRLVKRDGSFRLMLTCRDYSVDVVRSALLEHVALAHVVLEIPALDDEELDEALASLPQLQRPSSQRSLRSLFRSPYLLDKAARMQWPTSQPMPEDERSFRRKFWAEVVREDVDGGGGLPQRREQTLIEICLRRARSLRLFVGSKDLDHEALGRLRSHNLVMSPEGADSLVAPAHDVLEDWTILQWLEQQFALHEAQVRPFADDVGGHPAVRRAFRKWLAEQLACNTSVADSFVLAVIGDSALSASFRDDTLVSVLLSAHAAAFLSRHTADLSKDGHELLRRVIHLLRVACKTAPRWLSAGISLPSSLMVPEGDSWSAVLATVRSSLDGLIDEHVTLLVGLIEEWAAGVAWWAPYPEGAKDAAGIAFALLPHLDGYRGDELRRTTIKVIAKIPRGQVAAFKALVARAVERDRDDYAARDLGEIILQGLDGAFVCRDFPKEVIDLAESEFCLSQEDVRAIDRFSSIDVEPCFGIRDHLRHDFFPPSAYHGPFYFLLQHHLEEGVEFVLRLLNHSGMWYGERRWPHFDLEPAFEATIRVGDEEIRQWANGRFWAIYRGSSVAPSILQSALMALEGRLLELAKSGGEGLHSLLLYCLRKSNNVAVTAVVASVCMAYPKQAGEAGVALLTCRDFFEMDKWRMVNERAAGVTDLLGLPSLPGNKMHDEERRASSKLEHRRHCLETLALQLQLTPQRDSVWQILDSYRSYLPEHQDQTEEDRLWRLLLHRVDIRNFEVTDPPEGESGGPSEVKGAAVEGAEPKTYFSPGPVEDDIQKMLDDRVPEHELVQRDLALANWGAGAWSGEDTVNVAEWRERLVAAQARLGETEPLTSFANGGPGLVAAVCVRDHWPDMNAEERNWCATVLMEEVERDSDSSDMMTRMSRSVFDPARPAAEALSVIVKEEGRDAFGGRLGDAFARALTHAISEVGSHAAVGVSKHLVTDRRVLAFTCIGGLARKARLVAELRRSEMDLPYNSRRESSDLELEVLPEIREVLARGEVDAEEELPRLDLEDWGAREAASAILMVLHWCPEEAIATAFYTRLSRKLVQWWDRVRGGGAGSSQRDFKFEFASSRRLAHFVVGVTSENALRICEPVLDAVGDHPRDVGRFIGDLVSAEDRAGEGSPFWVVWQAFADRAMRAGWVRDLGSWRYDGEHDLVKALFLQAPWKDDIRHWKRLDGEAERLDRLFEGLPACGTCLESYVRFLDTVGGRSLPAAFTLISQALARGDAPIMLSRRMVVYRLESLLRRLVYSEPLRLKKDPSVRQAVLSIMDALVEAGSSSAYRMRDDFVTPVADS